MKRLHYLILAGFVVLLSQLFVSDLAVRAQEGPVSIEGLEPDAGLPGSEMEIMIYGSGFELIEQMELSIVDVEFHWAEIEADDVMRAGIFIAPDAPPGRKLFTLNYLLDNTPFRVLLRQGFEILPAEEQPEVPKLRLFSVEPREGEPDTQMELFLIGEGFESADEFAVIIDGVEIFDQWIESDEVIGLDIYIPEDTWPGWRQVEVEIVQDGRPPARAFLEEGFLVLEANQPLPPVTRPTQQGPPDTPGTPFSWIWPLSTLVLMVASFALGRSLAYRSRLSWTDQAKLQWRHEAKTELPEPQKACQWACKATVGANLLNRWKVTRIELTPLDVKGKTPDQKIVDNANGVLDPLNDLANIARSLHSQQAMRERIAGVVEEILTQIEAWGKEGQSPASVRIDAKLAGEVDATYGLYHCHQTANGLSWGKDPLLKWKAKLNQPAGEYLGVLRGPTAGEVDFSSRAHREVEDSLLDLIDLVSVYI